MIVMNQFRAYQASGLLYDLVAENALTATFLNRELGNLGSLANTIFRNH